MRDISYIVVCLLAYADAFFRLVSRRVQQQHQQQPLPASWMLFGAADNEEKMAEMVKMIMTAVDEGREEDLAKAGLKVTKKSPRELMDSKLSNPALQEEVLGPMDGEDELEIMRLLQNAQDESMNRRSSSSSSSVGISGYDDDVQGVGLDLGFLAELRADAQLAVQEHTKKGSAMAALLDDENSNGSGFDTGFDSNAWNPVEGTNTLLSPLDKAWAGEAPPTISSGSRFEVEEPEDEAIKDSVSPSSAAAAAIEGTAVATPNLTMTMAMMQKVEVEGGLTSEARELAQTTFASLLKATMDASEATASSVDEEFRKNTLGAVSDGDLSQLDVKSLLGEALTTLTESLGIDINAELKAGQVQGEMQAIIATSMSELATSMAELDEQSQLLYTKLGNLEEELRKETTAFEEKKADELEELLQKQTVFQSEVEASREKVQASSSSLQKLMSDLDERADALT